MCSSDLLTPNLQFTVSGNSVTLNVATEIGDDMLFINYADLGDISDYVLANAAYAQANAAYAAANNALNSGGASFTWFYS